MDHIGKNHVATFVHQYDELILLPLLNTVMTFWNLGQVVTLVPKLSLTRSFGFED